MSTSSSTIPASGAAVTKAPWPLWSWLGRALGDGENPSSSRLLALVCVPALVLVPLIVWAVLSLVAHSLLEIPGGVTAFVGATVSPMLAFVHLQKREETKSGGPS